LGRKPIPKPSYLDSCIYLGFINGERRWRSVEDDVIYTWDALHGELEGYNGRGQHIGAMDALTGKLIKPARKGRRIRV
jgi:hypothetical protein